MNLNQVTVTVSSIPEAVAFYRTLGLQQIVDSPHYARFLCTPGDTTFSVHIGQVAPATNAVIYFESASEQALYAQVRRLQQAGVVFDEEPVAQRWGWVEARLRDPDENRLVLYWAGEYRLNPPWRIPDEPAGQAPD